MAASDLAFGLAYGAMSIVADAALFLTALIVGLVMLNGIFRKGVAYLGIVGGIVGLIGSPYSPALLPVLPLGVALGIGFVLLIIWYILIGYKLHKLGSATSA